MIRFLIIILTICIPILATAVEYDCIVEKKFESLYTESVYPYTSEQLKKHQFSVKVDESSERAFFSRCSWTLMTDSVTCDRYEVDKIMFDANAKIKKFYLFGYQADVQIFSDLSFVENNGRGSVAYGKCRVIAP